MNHVDWASATICYRQHNPMHEGVQIRFNFHKEPDFRVGECNMNGDWQRSVDSNRGPPDERQYTRSTTWYYQPVR
ncbi:hypothetical protein T265_01521 [Opisthorchis viverrini]|uniref:Uncharacterized protein n=1 Tax=Opisthorchis viverrini TaxID=6198 RepID=A0A075AIZ0_OPIVI|nr:hypothetical protein T265_01521 [Opisthorchis viverrini]KER32469.1 hypothetical protein T265_01521 [Opisthorchis viverrini]